MAESIRTYLFVVFLVICFWLWMQVVHELGHVIGALASGGAVEKVVLHPFSISRTDITPNPFPSVVVWGGPVLGVGLPVVVWLVWSRFRCPHEKIVRFFCGFCFLANGLYLSIGCWGAIGDCRQMLQTGSPLWIIFLVGGVQTVLGFAFVNDTGEGFGLGDKSRKIDWWDVSAAAFLLGSTVSLELLLSEQI